MKLLKERRVDLHVEAVGEGVRFCRGSRLLKMRSVESKMLRMAG